MATPGFWERRLRDGIAGVAGGLFPNNDLGAPDWEETELVARTRSYMDELPPVQRRMLWTLFVAVELLAPLLVFGFRRFSRHTPERRARVVTRWRRSRFYLLRLLGDAFKACMTMMYMSHPAVIRHLGQFTHCENPDDPLEVPVQPAPFAEQSA